MRSYVDPKIVVAIMKFSDQLQYNNDSMNNLCPACKQIH